MIRKSQRGSSLFELMFVVILLFITLGVIFHLIVMVIQRSSAEQSKTDLIQEGREFMDQMSLDLRQAGYPSPRNFASSGVITATPISNDARVAAGVVKIGSGDLWLEGDVDGSGTVSVIHYHLDTGTTDNCPCLKRSQQIKIEGDPVSGQTEPVYQMEVQNVQNTDVFSAFTWGSTGTPITLPVDFTANGADIAAVDTIKVVLTLQSATPDSRTGQRPFTTLVSTVKLNNCSPAATGLSMSCQ